jgi:hypothetical protein
MIKEAFVDVDFGGNLNNFGTMKERNLEEAYHYDLNYQYSNAMKKSMPTGGPIFSNNTTAER